MSSHAPEPMTRISLDEKTLLELPDHHDVYSAATLGFPAVRLHSVPQREARAQRVSTMP